MKNFHIRYSSADCTSTIAGVARLGYRILQTKFVHSEVFLVRNEERCITVFTRSHSKSVKFIQANISLWFTHNGCFPLRIHGIRWDEELCTESMPDASMELRHWDHLYYCPRHLFTGATSGSVCNRFQILVFFFFFILMQSVCCRCAFIQFPLDREMYHSCSAVTSCCHFSIAR